MARDYLKPDSFDKTSAFEFITGRRPRRPKPWRKKKDSLQVHIQVKDARIVEYEDYIRSPEWRMFRHNIIMARGKQCQSCLETKGRIDLHHKHYKNFKCERPEDVILLCEDCHMSLHRSWRNGSSRKGVR